jgi:flagellar hook-basal body complex protein FliE
MHDLTHVTAGPVGALLAPGEQRPGAPSASTEFQALLERMQQFAQESPTAPAVDDPDQLRAAMARAEASFTTAMDLRQKLEEAFRRHQS